MATVTPDQLAHDLELAAKGLEFLHRIPPNVFSFVESFLNSSWTDDQLGTLSLLLHNRWTALELKDALETARTELPTLANFILSPSGLELAQRLRDDEQRKVLLALAARFFS